MSEYKTIPSFPMFEINDKETMDKCVRSVKTKEYCKVSLSGNGYPIVYLGKKLGGDGKQHKIHKLVCDTYIGPIPEGMECDHINCDKLCFLHTNIRIVNHKENCNNPLTLKHYSEGMTKYYSNLENRKKISEIRKQYFKNHHVNRIKASEAHDFQKKIVQQIDKYTGNIINEFFGIAEAGRLLNIDKTGISACCRGKCKTYKGYIFRFK